MKIINPYLIIPSLFSIAGAVGCSNASKESSPNIIFILSDDHTSQAWGVYGGILEDYVKNDNIERLANQGAVLDNCFCNNSLSAPSRASMLTGQYSHINKVTNLTDALPSEASTIAQKLQDVGYQTAIIGKWHLKSQPTGFDHFEVFPDQGTYRNPTFKNRENWVDDDVIGVGDKVEGFSTDIVTDKALEWMSKAKDSDKPFMLFCSFKATHEPWDFPERHKNLYDGVVFPEPETLLEFGSESSKRAFEGQPIEELAKRWENPALRNKDEIYPELPFDRDGLNAEEGRKKIYQKFIKDYLRCAAAIDDNIGRVLDFVEQNGIDENTIIIYTSDQGYFLGEHGFMDKRMMYEEALRMPFVIQYPKEIPAASRVDDMILNIDFPSLLADYASAEDPDDAQGISFREQLSGKTERKLRDKLYYHYLLNEPHKRPAHFGVRTERYKLMFIYGDKIDPNVKSNYPFWEFHDLQKDPQENINSYNDPQYTEIINELKHDILDLRKQYKDKDSSIPNMKEFMKNYYW